MQKKYTAPKKTVKKSTFCWKEMHTSYTPPDPILSQIIPTGRRWKKFLRKIAFNIGWNSLETVTEMQAMKNRSVNDFDCWNLDFSWSTRTPHCLVVVTIGVKDAMLDFPTLSVTMLPGTRTQHTYLTNQCANHILVVVIELNLPTNTIPWKYWKYC